MIQTRWCKYQVTCSRCVRDLPPHTMFVKDDVWTEVCDECGFDVNNYTVDVIPGSWREEGYPNSEIYKAGCRDIRKTIDSRTSQENIHR